MEKDMEPLVFDARPYQYEGREPFAYIMKALENLQPDQEFVLINTFDPRPLKAVIGARGFSCSVEVKGPEHVVVTFQKTPAARRGELPVVDRRNVSPDTAVVRMTGVLKRLKIEESFVLWLDQPLTPQQLNFTKRPMHRFSHLIA
jgi:uncharacterized protein (DUF2249 family)